MWGTALVATSVAGGLGWVIYEFLLGSPSVVGAAPIEVLKITLTLVAACGAVLTGVYAYRKQRLGEGAAARADADQFTQKHSSAAEQLGHDKAAVRLAGVYAMARLADDWAAQRQQCINVLCAYLRMPSDEVGLSEREVRATIVRTIADHLRDPSAISWVKHDFDFTGAVLDDAKFGVATFGAYTSFMGATFSGASFERATFSGGNVVFSGATFSGGHNTFAGATFSGGYVTFAGATFSGDYTSFKLATFSAASTTFQGATFSGAASTFERATFSGGDITFGDATFSGGVIIFGEATFSGAKTANEATTFSSFVGEQVLWGPITPRPLPSPGRRPQLPTGLIWKNSATT